MKEGSSGEFRTTVVRAIKIGLLLMTLLVGGIVVSAWFMGDQANLPFDYEGFD